MAWTESPSCRFATVTPLAVREQLLMLDTAVLFIIPPAVVSSISSLAFSPKPTWMQSTHVDNPPAWIIDHKAPQISCKVRNLLP
jgi:hypothetical protein